jgi:hypothetical protein
MIDDLRLLPKNSTAMDIALLVKAIPIDQAAELIEQYANTKAAAAKIDAGIEAAREAHWRTLRIQNAPLGKEGD